MRTEVGRLNPPIRVLQRTWGGWTESALRSAKLSGFWSRSMERRFVAGDCTTFGRSLQGGGRTLVLGIREMPWGRVTHCMEPNMHFVGARNESAGNWENARRKR